MIPVVLYRTSLGDTKELQVAKRYFNIAYQRSHVPRNSLVIGRYSVLPYYSELVADLAGSSSSLINSFTQHRYIADLGNWYRDLKDITPETWSHPDQLPQQGPFVVKGETNSKKFKWRTQMFAETREDAIRIGYELSDDGLLCDQHIYFRRYVPLVKLMDGIDGSKGLPITKEFRFFICDKKVVCGAYYWSNYEGDLEVVPSIKEVPSAFLQEVIRLVGDNARFYVVDVAQTQTNEWIVIELNDGQMSGLSCNEPVALYEGLYDILTVHKTT